MPQLKILDVQNRVEALEKDINQKFASLVLELKHILTNANITPDKQVVVSKLSEDLETLKKDLIGHVQVYNQHIVQQHSRKQ